MWLLWNRSSILKKGTSALSERAVWLTLDDGYIDNFSFVFPILEEFSL